MINIKEIVKSFKEEHDDLTIIKAALYDDKLYIIEAVRDKSKPDYNSPYYAFDKNTGEPALFSPTDDIVGFREAFRSHLININGG